MEDSSLFPTVQKYINRPSNVGIIDENKVALFPDTVNIYKSRYQWKHMRTKIYVLAYLIEYYLHSRMSSMCL